MAVSVGDVAPDFTLKSKSGELEDVTLGSFKGEHNVVLLFFPLAFTSVCTDEMCSVSGGIADYEGLNAKVLAISVDSPFAQEAWANANDITIPILSDFNKEVSGSYGSLYEDLLGFKGVSKRSAFVVDREGVIRYAEVSEDAKVIPDFDAVKKCLESLS
jgi:peroxiredoxin